MCQACGDPEHTIRTGFEDDEDEGPARDELIETDHAV